ncbi:MAG: adenosylhomocysteinase [Thermovirgaceae bacterium]|nr:adenosylhomocysteinase [Synergistales bacterium]HPC75243.1 adenosylhomocysteinase [Synergistales bacterium]HRU90485.1 adenosylhomocysteinase [Thermovirgaceae bacterium]
MKGSRIADASLSGEGERKVLWARGRMPVLAKFVERSEGERPLSGVTVGACLHLEAKTACLLLALKELGAEVAAAGSNPLSTQDDVCAYLVREGVAVFSWRGMSGREYFENLESVLDRSPGILVDDGADLVVTAHEKYPALLPRVRGGSEETTTGVRRLKAMMDQGVLAFPVISVNDARSKFLFDNRYGTGQSVFDGLMRATNVLIAGKVFVVAGYGWCGRGVAMRAKGFGARVVVVETDPHRAFEALMDGCQVCDMMEAAAMGDLFLTLTGNRDVIREEHFRVMKDGAILGNAGHFDVEIDKIALEQLSKEVCEARDNVTTYVLGDGRRISLLAQGRLVNLAAGDGHPIEIMDLSFGLQLGSVLHLAENRLPPGVYDVPGEIDSDVVRTALEARGIRLEAPTREQEEYLRQWRE